MTWLIGIAALGVVLRLWWFSIFDILHPDELMQYLEQGNRIATGHGIVPWEWRYGIRNALIPQVLSLPLAMGHAIAPGTLAAVWLARLTFAAMIVLLAFWAAFRLGASTSWRHGFLALFVVATWWESVLYGNLLLTESLGAALLLAGAALLLAPARARPALLAAGLFITFGVLVRFQFAAFALVLAVGALGRDRRAWTLFLIGCLVAGLVGAASDLVAGMAPFSWAWNNVAMNIGQGRAGRFGTSGPFTYVLMLNEQFYPGLIILLLAAAWSGRRYRPLFWAACANIAAHSLVAHKEYRFVWLSVLALLVLAAIGTVRLPDWLAARRGGMMTRRSRAGWLAGLALAWAAASMFTAWRTDGIPAFQVGGTLPRLANAALADPTICTIAIDWDDKAHIVPSLLRRPVPLLLVQREPEQPVSAPPPPDVTRGANALIIERRPGGVPGYRERDCTPFGGATSCLYVREGGCVPTPPRSYQRVLEKNDL